MGIKGLWTLIEKNRDCLCHESHIRGRLIVDGYPILHKLYDNNNDLDWVNGGRYGRQYQVTISYFKKLVEGGAEPIVVVDGGGCQQQLDETLNRRKETIQEIPDMLRQKDSGAESKRIMPLMAREIFVSSLRENGIDVYVADGKASKTIVRLANHYECPVLVTNTNYCVCNVKGGVIFYDDLIIGTCTASIFEQNKLVEFLHLRSPDLLYFVVAIMGDGHDTSVPYLYHGRIRGQIESALRDVDEKRSWILNVTDFLQKKGFTSFEGVKHSTRSLNFGGQSSAFLNNCIQVEKVFMNYGTISADDLCKSTTIRCSKPCDMPFQILRGFRNGTFPVLAINAMTLEKCILEHCVGDLEQSPPSQLGLNVRKLIYGLVSDLKQHEDIKEYHRAGLSYKDHSVTPTLKYEELMVTKLYCEDDKTKKELAKQAICEVLNCPDDHIMHALDNEAERSLILVTLVTRCWAENLFSQEKKPPKPEQLVKALVLNFFLNLNAPDRKLAEVDNSKHGKEGWREIFHALLVWKSLYRNAHSLNAMLLEPLQPMPSCRLFDGPLVIFLALATAKKISVYEGMLTAEHKGQFDKLFSLILPTP